MANIQLTLTQRSQMANNDSFMQRIQAAMKGTAQYWKDFQMTQVSHFNVATKKKKEFARKILQGGTFSEIRAYTGYLLNQYRYDDVANPNGSPDLDGNGQLNDAILSDSSASTATFEYFAGVEVGDESEIVDF